MASWRPSFSALNYDFLFLEVSKGAKQSSTTPDPRYHWESDTLPVRHHKREPSPFKAGDHKAHLKRRALRHNKIKTEKTHKRSTKEVTPWNGQ